MPDWAMRVPTEPGAANESFVFAPAYFRGSIQAEQHLACFYCFSKKT